VCALLKIYSLVLFARAIISWFPHLPDAMISVARVLFVLTEPVVRLFRPLLPPLRVGNLAMDMSFLLLVFLIILLQRVFC
jgi:YggT family protein